MNNVWAQSLNQSEKLPFSGGNPRQLAQSLPHQRNDVGRYARCLKSLT